MEMTISNILRDKSFVDDLNKEQGIVSMRVGSALRSTEIKPLFPDLWRKQKRCVFNYTYRFVFDNSNHPLGELYRRVTKVFTVWATDAFMTVWATHCFYCFTFDFKAVSLYTRP